MKSIVGLGMMCFTVIQSVMAQIDTSYVYRTGMPYGTLDIRIAKSATRYYYLQENKTFSFRESSPGVRTETYQDMTSWDSSPYTQGNLREKNGTADAFIMNYRLLIPQNYNASYPEGYPLILMVHGAGERGNCWDNSCHWADRNWRPQTNTPAAPTASNHPLLNNDHNLLHGGQVHLQARNLAGSRLPNDPSMPDRAFPGFVLFPQNINGWDGNSIHDVIRIVRLLMKKYNIDENRVYVHGLSNGGYGVYETIKRAPALFAAALTMSAVSDASLTSASHAPVLQEMSNIPLWTFQGGIDTNPTPARTRTIVKRFRDAGMVVRFSEYASLGHGTWNTAYNEPDFFKWMLQKNKANIHTKGGVPAICKTTGQGALLQLSKGYLAYQWEHNGTIIPGATGATYTANIPGVYRARFSRVSANPTTEAQWNRWSGPVTVTESDPSQAQIIQKGTVHLKDLNNYTNAHLSAVGDFEHYYWYKDGVLLDLPGTLDDTTKNPIFKQGTCTNLPACTGNGTYTLVTAGVDNCPSPVSEPKYVYFNNQSAINITAPTAFTGTATSASTATVNWSDASSNELGFELWRRKITGAGTYTKWHMATITGANVTAFNDTGLEPSSTYQYKIRAVGTAGRSNYTPLASTQYLLITTQGDNVAPSTPNNLVATASGIREITLNWEASTDNTGIRYYTILFGDQAVNTPNALTTFKLTELNLNQVYSFTVKAVDLGGNQSEASNNASASTYMTGLYYEHSTGGWTDLDQINWNSAEFKGKVTNFTLTPRTQEDYFNFEFDGYLYITISGDYQFRTTSDDGSRLTLNNAVIVENDGTHGNVTITSLNQTLTSGPQLVNVKYFEYTGGHSLAVQYRGPDTGNTWISIPNSALKSGDESVIQTASARSSVVEIPQPKTMTTTAFPNPMRSSDQLTVTADVNENEMVQVSLLNMVGESYYEETIPAVEIASGKPVLPRRQLKNGVYILVIRQGDKAVKQRVMVKD